MSLTKTIYRDKKNFFTQHDICLFYLFILAQLVLLFLLISNYIILFLGLVVGCGVILALLKNIHSFLIIFPIVIAVPLRLAGSEEGGGQILVTIEVMTFLIALIWFFRFAITGKLGKIKPIQLFLMLSLALTPLPSLINSRYLLASVNQWGKLVEGFVFVFFVTYNLSENLSLIRKAILSIIVGGSLASLLGIYQFFVVSPGSRIYAVWGGSYGCLLGTSLVLGLSLLAFSHSRLERIAICCSLPFLLAALILSQTRAWVLATLIAILFVIVNTSSWRRLLILVLIFLIVAGIVILAATYWLSSQGLLRVVLPLLARFVRPLQPGKPLTEVVPSMQERFYAWDRDWHAFLHHPIIGNGLGNVRLIFGATDNHYLWVLAETGVIGLIPWLLLFSTLFTVACRSIRLSRGSGWEGVPLGLVSALIVYMVGGIFWSLTERHGIVLLLPFLGALIFSTERGLLLLGQSKKQEDCSLISGFRSQGVFQR